MQYPLYPVATAMHAFHPSPQLHQMAAAMPDLPFTLTQSKTAQSLCTTLTQLWPPPLTCGNPPLQSQSMKHATPRHAHLRSTTKQHAAVSLQHSTPPSPCPWGPHCHPTPGQYRAQNPMADSATPRPASSVDPLCSIEGSPPSDTTLHSSP